MSGEVPFRRELRETVWLAAPLMAGNAGNQMLSMVDTAVVGRLGPVEMAGTGLGSALFFIAASLGIGTLLGLDPLVSQAVGAGHPARARRSLHEGLVLALLQALPLALLVVGAWFLLGPIGIDEATRQQASFYLWGRLPSLIPLGIYTAFRAYLQAVERPRSVLWATIAANVANIPLSILLTFGDRALLAAGLPALGLGQGWGVLGAGLASTLVTTVQALVLFWALRAAPRPPGSHPPTRAGLRALFRLGWPIGLQMMVEVGSFVMVTVLMGLFGPQILAGHQIAIKLASFTFTLCVGLGNATAVRVGHAVGRQDPAGAWRAGLTGTLLAMALMTFFAFLFWQVPAPLAGLLARPPEVIAVAVSLLQIAALFQLFDGIQAVGAGMLRGAGDTRFPLVANLISHWFLGLPLGAGLAFFTGVGPAGLWWGLTLALALASLALLLRFLYLTGRPLRPLDLS